MWGFTRGDIKAYGLPTLYERARKDFAFHGQVVPCRQSIQLTQEAYIREVFTDPSGARAPTGWGRHTVTSELEEANPSQGKSYDMPMGSLL